METEAKRGWRVSCCFLNWKYAGKHSCTVTRQGKVIMRRLLEEEIGSEDELLLQGMLTPIFKGFSLQGPPKSSHYLSPYAAF